LRNLPLDRGEPAVNCVPPCGTSLRSTGSQLPSAIRRTGASARNAGSPPTRATRINSSSICAASLAIGVVLLRRGSEFVEQLFRQLGRGPMKKPRSFLSQLPRVVVLDRACRPSKPGPGTHIAEAAL